MFGWVLYVASGAVALSQWVATWDDALGVSLTYAGIAGWNLGYGLVAGFVALRR